MPRVNGLEEVRRLLQELKEELPRAAVRAQNRMAYALKQGLDLQMIADFDRPKQFSRSAVRYDAASLGGPGARVYLRDETGAAADEQHYLGVQTLGGVRRRLRRSEQLLQSRGLMPRGYVWVPSKFAPLDQYGNVSAARIQAILGVGRYQRGTDRYVVVGDPGREKGIWQRFPDGRFLPILIFVSPRQYNERYEFYQRAEREVDARLIPILDEELTRALQGAA